MQLPSPVRLTMVPQSPRALSFPFVLKNSGECRAENCWTQVIPQTVLEDSSRRVFGKEECQTLEMADLVQGLLLNPFHVELPGEDTCWTAFYLSGFLS